MIRELSKIHKIKRLSSDIFSIWLDSPVITKQAKPGQFVQVQVTDSIEPFLCRPFSIADLEDNKLRIIYRIIGKGTRLLQQKQNGDKIYIYGPLGKPIEPIKEKNIILCAGGVGIAPLFFLARNLYKKNKLFLFFGARNKSEMILLNELKPLCQEICLSTEDGSKGKKGVVTDLLYKKIDHLSSNPEFSSGQYLFVAGPTEMLQNIKSTLNSAWPGARPGFKGKSQKLKIKVYGFLEERMGCGCGICFGCAVKKKGGGYLRVCVDGPAIDLAEIEL